VEAVPVSVFGDATGNIARLLHFGYRPGGYAVMADGIPLGSAVIPAANTLYLYPFRVYATITVTSLFQRVQTVGAGSSIKTAVWRNSMSRPTGLPLFGQNAGFDTSSSNGIKSASIANYVLPAGTYWGGTKGTGTLPAMTGLSATSYAPGALISAPSQNEALGVTAGQLVGFSTPDDYANDIMATDLTSATFTAVNTTGIPVLALGWA
jgi:hypothetical protein